MRLTAIWLRADGCNPKPDGSFVAGMCQTDAGRCPDVEAPTVGCRQPKLCIGYNKDTWKTEDMADGMLVPDKTGTKSINLERYFVFVQIRKPSKSDSIKTRNCYLQKKEKKKKPRMILRCEYTKFTFSCLL